MKTTVELDASNRIVLSRDLRRTAGIARRQKCLALAMSKRGVTLSRFEQMAPGY